MPSKFSAKPEIGSAPARPAALPTTRGGVRASSLMIEAEHGARRLDGEDALATPVQADARHRGRRQRGRLSLPRVVEGRRAPSRRASARVVVVPFASVASWRKTTQA